MKLYLLAFFLMIHINSSSAAVKMSLTGAGGTFPAPIYTQWAETYQNKMQIQINYQAVGSGSGIEKIKARTVDFGASDKPLTSDELEKNNLFQFPTVLGAIVPIINLPHVSDKELKLTGQVLSNIFLGKIKKWSDPAIAELNPDVKLEDLEIQVVHRNDASGTSFLFTDYLSKVNPAWAKAVGSGISVEWPTGVGAKGNQGVALYVNKLPGAIGYVEYAYALVNHMTTVQLKNKANQFVTPSNEGITSAARYANWNDPSVVLTDEPGNETWPISGATYILIPKNPTDASKAKAVLNFFDWAFHFGSAAAEELHYVALPLPVIELQEKQWMSEIKDSKGQSIWNKPTRSRQKS